VCDQVECLEYEPDCAAPKTGPLLISQSRDLYAIEAVASRRLIIQQAQNVQQRGFARPGWAGNRQPLASLYDKIHSDEGVKRRIGAKSAADPP
jgi:hypothetical protein